MTGTRYGGQSKTGGIHSSQFAFGSSALSTRGSWAQPPITRKHREPLGRGESLTQRAYVKGYTKTLKSCIYKGVTKCVYHFSAADRTHENEINGFVIKINFSS